MKEDFGPITECPCRKNTIPKIMMAIPIIINDFTALNCLFYEHQSIKGKES